MKLALVRPPHTIAMAELGASIQAQLMAAFCGAFGHASRDPEFFNDSLALTHSILTTWFDTVPELVEVKPA